MEVSEQAGRQLGVQCLVVKVSTAGRKYKVSRKVGASIRKSLPGCT